MPAIPALWRLSQEDPEFEASLSFLARHCLKGREEGRKEGREGGREEGREGGREGGRKEVRKEGSKKERSY
jgi:flagellar biosynthesis/type III secretory pathway protein FliH